MYFVFFVEVGHAGFKLEGCPTAKQFGGVGFAEGHGQIDVIFRWTH